MSPNDAGRPKNTKPSGPQEPAYRRAWSAVRQHSPLVWKRARWLLFRLAMLFGSFLLFSALLVFGAGWYTSRSEFCNSCHIMEPYYESWRTSSHSDVSCIECHFEPGFGGKLRGKMLGLVQLAKYVTKSEGPRPAAEIPDASCLRSGCHESRLLSGKVEFMGMQFDHTPHLGERRGKELRCTSCHSQIVQGEHMAVTISTCYLCHFKDEPFNEGLAACTRCHSIPTKEYDLGGGVKFTHELAYKEGVDCSNCHADVVRGNGEVPPERCMVCHNRPGDLALRTDTKLMHQKHVTDHKIDCLDCHLTIEHSFDEERLLHASLNCTGCHPNHHQEQVAMFKGTVTESVPVHPGGMLAARIGCRSCHREKEEGATGAVVWKASAEVCAMCHDQKEVDQLQAFHRQLRAALPEIQAAADRAQKALESANLPSQETESLRTVLQRLQRDLALLRTGNDIHNIHYASRMERELLQRVREISQKLGIEPPKVELPDSREQWK